MSSAEEKLLILQSSIGELPKHNPQWSKEYQPNDPNEADSLVNLSQLPVAIGVTEQAGRQLVATRHVCAGEILFREPVLLPLVPRQSSGPTCLNCLKTLPDESYPQCEFCGVPLCLTECDGKLHSLEECQVLSKKGLKNEQNLKKKLLQIMEINTILTPLRAILTFKKNPEVRAKVGVLEANMEKRANIDEEINADKKIISVMQNLLDDEVDTDEIFRVCACYDTNSFGVQVSKSYPGRARAMFLITSMMNHDCTQNTEHWYDNGFMNVRAAVDIPEGAAITLSYSEVLWGTKPRQRHLEISKFFNCCCQRCSSPTELETHLSSILCQTCGNLVEPSHHNNTPNEAEDEIFTCNKCSWTVTNKQLLNWIKSLGLTASMVSSSNLQALRKLYSDVVRIFGTQHYTVVLLQYRILQALDDKDLQELDADILREVLGMSEALNQAAEVIAPGMSSIRGQILLRHLRIACELIARINKGLVDTYLSHHHFSVLSGNILLRYLWIACELKNKINKGENLNSTILAKELFSRIEKCNEIFKFQEEYLAAISEVEHTLKLLTNSKEEDKSSISRSSFIADGFKGTDRHLWYHLFLERESK